MYDCGATVPFIQKGEMVWNVLGEGEDMVKHVVEHMVKDTNIGCDIKRC